MSEYKVVDKRRTEDGDPGIGIPASLNAEDVQEVIVAKDKLFVHPTAGRILVQGDAAAGKIGRILMPQKVQRAPTTGTILEIGAGVNPTKKVLTFDKEGNCIGEAEEVQEIYKEGMKIAYGLYSGTVLTFKGWDPKTRINFRILNADEILAIVDKDSPELEGVGI